MDDVAAMMERGRQLLSEGLHPKPAVIRSVYDKQDRILAAIQHLHCPEGYECDATYGNGGFWRTLARPGLCFDIDPSLPDVMEGDSTALPVESGSLNNLVFDPPFLTYVKKGREHQGGKVRMTARFGGYWTYGELEAHYQASIIEARRVLKVGGKMVFKCQDIIHNHRMHCTHARVIAMAEANGMRLLDLFILPAKHRMPMPGHKKSKQRHARIFHSYFLVLQKLKSSDQGPEKQP